MIAFTSRLFCAARVNTPPLKTIQFRLSTGHLLVSPSHQASLPDTPMGINLSYTPTGKKPTLYHYKYNELGHFLIHKEEEASYKTEFKSEIKDEEKIRTTRLSNEAEKSGVDFFIEENMKGKGEEGKEEAYFHLRRDEYLLFRMSIENSLALLSGWQQFYEQEWSKIKISK